MNSHPLKSSLSTPLSQPSAAPCTSYPLPYITSRKKKEREKLYLMAGMAIKIRFSLWLTCEKY
jgi:hypothetical protein